MRVFYERIEVVSLNMITTSNLFLMNNNVAFIFRTSKHNTECFFISFRARKSIMFTSLEDNVCLCDHRIFFTEVDPLAGPSE